MHPIDALMPDHASVSRDLAKLLAANLHDPRLLTALKIEHGTASVAPSPGGPHSAERSQDLGHPSSGGVGNSLGQGEGELPSEDYAGEQFAQPPASVLSVPSVVKNSGPGELPSRHIAPCPFCGGLNAHPAENSFCVYCPGCGARGPDFHVSDRAAITAWNRRP